MKVWIYKGDILPERIFAEEMPEEITATSEGISDEAETVENPAKVDIGEGDATTETGEVSQES